MPDWNPHEVVKLLLDLARQLQKLDEGLEGLEKDAVEKAEVFNQAHLDAFLRADGPQYLREAIADKATHEERLASKLAEVMVRGQKRKMDILRERIGVGRTAAASLRAELELERVPR